MDKIGVLLKEDGSIGSFQNSKKCILFGKENQWTVLNEITIDSENISNMQKLRSYYESIVEDLEDCRIIVVEKAQGIPYGVFFENDYSIWELGGQPEEHLDNILKGEDEYIKEMEEKEKESVAKEIEEGYYLIDLEELQLTRPELTSKKAIIPFLDNEEFNILEVRCCHIPPWLIQKEKDNEIKMDSTKVKSNKFKLLIQKSF